MICIERHLDDAAMTEAIGRTLGRALRAGDVLELNGELGAGKTTLTRGISVGMGLDPRQVSSPTFVILHRYTPPADTAGPELSIALVHMDAYRFDAESTLDELGWDRAIADAAVCVEWPDRLGTRLHDDMHARLGDTWRDHLGAITLEHAIDAAGNDTRHIAIDLPDAWGDRDAVKALVNNPPRTCPRLGSAVEPDGHHYPFSSERARLADLHDWFAEGYTVSRPMNAEDYEGLEGM